MAFVEVQKEGKIAKLQINRPEALNALNEEVLMELRNAVIKLDDISVAVFTGAGEKAFVAGADIKKMQTMTALQASAFSELGQGVVRLIEDSPFITIAAVNGFALGGGLELALACDLIYAADHSKFGAPETNLGIIPGFGGTVNLYDRVGFQHSMELILSGRTISADEAKRIQLVADVFPKDELMNEVMKRAQNLSQKGIYSMLAAKRLVRGMAAMDRQRAFLLERESFGSLFATGEPTEGMSAFVEKRSPKFN